MNILELIEINKRVCSNLWNLAYVGQSHIINKSDINGLSPKLVIPTYQRNEPSTVEESRISEQESRVLFCDVLNDTNYFYSIETPTLCNYEFSNLKRCLEGELHYESSGLGTSARSDLSIYQQEGSIPGKSELIKLANVEFKAHNPEKTAIYKDVVKLCFESKNGQVYGNWFHTLKNTDSGTIPSLFNKFIESFEAIENAISNKTVKSQAFPNSIKILFCFCVLEKKWGCTRLFEWSGGKQPELSAYAADFFAPSGISCQTIEPKNGEQLKKWTSFQC